LLLAVVSFASYANAATPNLTVGGNTVVPDIGKVASGTADTTVTVDSGGVATISATGGANFIPPTVTTRTSQQTLTIGCSGGGACNKNNVTVVITATGGTNRLATITGFSVGGGTAVLASGSASSCTGCSSLTITIKPVAASGQNSGSATIGLGMTSAIKASGTIGAATSGYSVQASGGGYNSSTVFTANMKATVEGKLGMLAPTNLAYGVVVLTGNGTITWDAATQTLSTNPTGLVVQKGTTSIGTFTVTGTPGQTINFTLSGNAGLPNFITLTKNPGSGSINITPSTTGQSSQTILGNGTFPFYVGGTINLSTTTTGHYEGTFTVTANYQ
jgi:hypothetical protein